jgi:orotate phosphoribosyltransferase
VSQAFIDAMDKLPERPRAIGGLTMGADFITAAVAMKTYELGLQPVSGSIARKEPKKHGTMKKIENELPAGTPIVVIDDVITTGNSTKTACREFLAAGYRVVGIIVLIDREEANGRSSLEKEYGTVVSLFTRSDFPRAIHVDEQLHADKGRFAAAA